MSFANTKRKVNGTRFTVFLPRDISQKRYDLCRTRYVCVSLVFGNSTISSGFHDHHDLYSHTKHTHQCHDIGIITSAPPHRVGRLLVDFSRPVSFCRHYFFASPNKFRPPCAAVTAILFENLYRLAPLGISTLSSLHSARQHTPRPLVIPSPTTMIHRQIGVSVVRQVLCQYNM